MNDDVLFLFVMLSFTVTILLLAMLKVRKRNRKLRALESDLAQARLDGERSRDRPETASAGKIKLLEDRLRVLERIVTDGGYALGQEIERLRELRRETFPARVAASADSRKA